MDQTVITGTGFAGAERREVRAAATACGASYSGDLQKDVTTHLVVRRSIDGGRMKGLRAAEWGIPAVRWAWLKASAQAGTLLATQPYLLRHQSAAPPPDQAALNARAPAEPVKASGVPAAAAAVPDRSVPEQQRQQSVPAGRAAAADRGAAQQENVPPAGSTAGASELRKAAGGKSDALAAALQRLKVAAPSQQHSRNSPHITSRSGHSITPPAVAPATAASAAASAADPIDAIRAVGEAHVSAASVPALQECPVGSDAELDHLVSSDGTVDLEEAASHSQGDADEQPGQVVNTAAAQLTDDDLLASGHQTPAESGGSGNCSTVSASEDDVQCAQRPPGHQAPRQHRRIKRAEPSPPPQLQSPQPLAPAPPAASPAEMEAAAAKVEPPPPAVHACGGRSVASPPAWAVLPRTLHDQLFDSPDASAASRSLVAPSSRLSGSLAPQAPPPGDGSVAVIKPASRQPRGGTAADFHVLNRKQLQRVAFAEQVQVSVRGLMLNCKDKKTAVVIQAAGQPLHQQPRPVLAELKSMYCLPQGTWYAEYMRFYTAADIEELAARHSVSIALPADFEHNNERLRGIERLHCPLLDVTGQRTIRHSKTVGRVKSNSGLFWRSCFDKELRRCVTDKPVTAFVG